MALRIRHIAVLLLGLVLVAVACGGTEPEPLPDIDATVEAMVSSDTVPTAIATPEPVAAIDHI